MRLQEKGRIPAVVLASGPSDSALTETRMNRHLTRPAIFLMEVTLQIQVEATAQ